MHTPNSCPAASRRARFIRCARIEWSPFNASKAPATLFGLLSTKKVREASPKLVLEKALLPRSAQTQFVHLSFVDGSKRTFDLGQFHTDEVLLEIDSENGRLDTEAMFSGKPWPN